ncbi:hypothetical protein V8F20_006411 [Naviculisporaceae sp. PSN 640]
MAKTPSCNVNLPLILLATLLFLLVLTQPAAAALSYDEITKILNDPSKDYVGWKPTFRRFEAWYPQYRPTLNYILSQNCSTELFTYRSGNYSAPIDDLGGGDAPSHIIQPLVQCIMDALPEYIKMSMSASQVLLGVTPTILSILGPSVEESALLYIVGRRPILAWFLALGSPSVYFSRAFEYRNPVEILQGHHERVGQQCPRRKVWELVVVAVEYTVALGSVANLILQTWELGVQTFCSIWPNTFGGPTIWLVLRIVLHMLSLLLVRLRIRRNACGGGVVPGKGLTKKEWTKGIWERAVVILRRYEFKPCVTQGPRDGEVDRAVSVDVWGETRGFITVAWILHTLTVVHILFGTLVFSSLMFIGTRDAVFVLGRFMASVLFCRVILMYEIAGLREAFLQSNDEEPTTITVVTSRKVHKAKSLDSLQMV